MKILTPEVQPTKNKFPGGQWLSVVEEKVAFLRAPTGEQSCGETSGALALTG